MVCMVLSIVYYMVSNPNPSLSLIRDFNIFSLCVLIYSIYIQYIFSENGKNVEQSYEKAVKYFTMAAEQGDAGAQTNLGCMYMNGSGVEQSCAIARKWWAKAANQGQEDAIKLLKTPEKIERTTTTLSSRCSACGKPKSKYQKLRKCSGCHAVQYCNTECQKKHWKIGGHKKECKKLKQQQQNTK